MCQAVLVLYQKPASYSPILLHPSWWWHKDGQSRYISLKEEMRLVVSNAAWEQITAMAQLLEGFTKTASEVKQEMRWHFFTEHTLSVTWSQKPPKNKMFSLVFYFQYDSKMTAHMIWSKYFLYLWDTLSLLFYPC